MKSINIISTYDGLKLAVALCEPQGEARGIFQIVHGMAEHKERYYPFMEFLAQNGYVAVIADIRGHGESVKNVKDLGYMYKGRWKAMVEDVKSVRNFAAVMYPGMPITLFGHSMGSMVVRSFAKRYDSLIDRLIVCGSPSDNPAKGAGAVLATLIAAVCGGHHRSALLNAMSFGAYNKPFASEGEFAWLSRNRANVEAYIADPLCGYCFTANGFRGLMGVMKDCYSDKDWTVAKPEMPVLFISGGDDPCRTDDLAFDSAVDFFRQRGYTNVSSKLYQGLRHEILLETEAPMIFEDILSFIS